jgi:hypothetical protein
MMIRFWQGNSDMELTISVNIEMKRRLRSCHPLVT